MSIEPSQQNQTWKDVVEQALRKLGGEGHLDDITKIANEHPKAENNNFVAEKIRQVVRAYQIFETVEDEKRGTYRLRYAQQLPETLIEKAKDITDEIQGKLLYIGRANDFETYAPADDQSKRVFNDQPLKELVTLQDGLNDMNRFTSIERKKIGLIDVLWFREQRGELVLHCAFEVENTTNVATGLERLNYIHPMFNTKLVIVGGDEWRRKRYEELMKSPTWYIEAERFRYRSFDLVREVFEGSATYRQAKIDNEHLMHRIIGD